MKKFIFLSVIFLIIVAPLFAFSASSFGENLTGKILLQTEEKGQAWYVDPITKQRAFLGRPNDAFHIMSELGLGIKHAELEKYLKSGFPKRLSGKILLDVEKKGEAYYVYPDSLKGYYLNRPADAFRIMSNLGLGISNKDLEKIVVSEKYKEKNYSSNSASGKLLQDNVSGGIYLIDGKTKSPIIDPSLLATKYKDAEILAASPEELAKYQTNTPVLLSDGTLVKSKNSETIYLIKKGKKKIISQEVFTSSGYKIENIITISPQLLYLYDLYTEEDTDTSYCQNGETKTCETKELGECKAGKRICENNFWGNCERITSPLISETCGDGKDNNCDGKIDENCQAAIVSGGGGSSDSSGGGGGSGGSGGSGSSSNICGNGQIGAGEECDDSNTTNGDGCSSSCQTEGNYYMFATAVQHAGNLGGRAGADLKCNSDSNKPKRGNFNLAGTYKAYISTEPGYPGSILAMNTNYQIFRTDRETKIADNITGLENGNILNAISNYTLEGAWSGGDGRDCDDWTYTGFIDKLGDSGNCGQKDSKWYSQNNGGGAWCRGQISHLYCIGPFDHPTSSSCGDGFADESKEECDDGNTVSGDGCSATCNFENKYYMFATAIQYAGNLGGRAGADFKCNSDVNRPAGISGTYKAYISTEPGYPGSSMGLNMTYPIFKNNGTTVIANSLTDLENGNILNPISDYSLDGAWSGGDGRDCSDWNIATSSPEVLGDGGNCGQKDSKWYSQNNAGGAWCKGQISHIYCIGPF